MKDTLQIHETAFVTATYRASNEELSKDVYSKYWKNSKTDKWIKSYLEKVSNEEPYTHCLRNRYFYETIKRLKENKEIEVLVNLGCGFSMYPFIFENDLINIEIDKKDIINHKKTKVQKLMKSGKLPDRQIHYIAKDFNLEKKELSEEIKSIINGRPSFVILEGVLFFLSKAITNELFELISEIQTPGSYLGSVSFLESIVDTACFKRLVHFFDEEVNLNSKFEYLTLPTNYYKSIPSYELIEREDYVSLSKKYSPKDKIENGDLILNENMYLLKRK
ncbi:class I SAM-dependent methyltransferase [uncultured Dokdonia sp.]|uniref:class I SAM-dependent methyltransferase n=1 Tax=uncultured Dokdonia sp. TaxID=575653 RepID=UPI002610B478|nr:class I SAM-dependent methyltransferase [uncultured Dokdonia sp.]